MPLRAHGGWVHKFIFFFNGPSSTTWELTRPHTDNSHKETEHSLSYVKHTFQPELFYLCKLPASMQPTQRWKAYNRKERFKQRERTYKTDKRILQRTKEERDRLAQHRNSELGSSLQPCVSQSWGKHGFLESVPSVFVLLTSMNSLAKHPSPPALVHFPLPLALLH